MSCITIGIDSGSHFCGVAVFENGIYKESFYLEFPGTYSLVKLREIVSRFNEIFKKYKPTIVVIEEPLAVRNGKVTRMLNLIGGSIFSQACAECDTVDFIHNKTLKRLQDIKTKEESIEKAKIISLKDNLIDDEADAILLVDSYIKLVDVHGNY